MADANLTRVTDPNILAQLNAGSSTPAPRRATPPRPVISPAPVNPTATPGFRGSVTAAETRGREQWKETSRTVNGKTILGQVNVVTGEFKPYAKEFQSEQTTPTTDELAAARADALRFAGIAKELERSSKEDWFSTGFLAPTLSGYGGTAANTVKANVETLKQGGALKTLLEMSQKTGKNLLTPMSNSDVQLLSGAKQPPLDIGMRDTDFQSNARQYFNTYKNAYVAAGGSEKQFYTDLARLQGRASGSQKAKYSGISVERIK